MANKNIKFPESLLERYSSVRQVGSGASGSVFRAHDTILLKDVAIKVLPKSATPRQIVRFQREAKAISKLNHPNVVKVLDFDTNKAGDVYMIMEFVAGQTLKSYLRRRKEFDIVFSIDCFLQICEGMSHAHQNNILHRDLKPANIIIDQGKDSGLSLKIIDFGIARVLDQGVELTTGQVATGTPAYMSPEQGRGERVDERSDIYSFGCIMYEFLKGALPFQGDNSMDVLFKHQNEPIPELKETFNGQEVSQEFYDVIFKALQKEKENRYSTFEELMVALKELRESSVQEFEPPVESESSATPLFTTFKFMESTPASGFILVVLTLVAITSCFCFIYIERKGNPPELKSISETAEEPIKQIPLEEVDEELAISELPEKLKTESDSFLLSHFEKLKQEKDWYNAISVLNVLLKRNSDSETILKKRADCYLRLGSLEAADRDIDALLSKKPKKLEYLLLKADVHASRNETSKAIEIYSPLIEQYPRLTYINENRARCYFSQGQWQKAVDDCTVQLKLSPHNYPCLRRRARSNFKLGNYEKVVEDTTTIMNIRKNRDYAKRDEVLLLRAKAHMKLHNLDLAVRDLNTSIKNNPDDSRIYELLSQVYEMQGKTSKAQAAKIQAKRVR